MDLMNDYIHDTMTDLSKMYIHNSMKHEPYKKKTTTCYYTSEVWRKNTKGFIDVYTEWNIRYVNKLNTDVEK